MPRKQSNKKLAHASRVLGGSLWSDIRHGRIGQALGKIAKPVKEALKKTKVISQIAKEVPVVGNVVSEAIEKRGYGRMSRRKMGGAKKPRKRVGGYAVKF
jgi:hypothetical protein